eukprot:2893585-Pyramimonas_sp.AAC.1
MITLLREIAQLLPSVNGGDIGGQALGDTYIVYAVPNILVGYKRVIVTLTLHGVDSCQCRFIERLPESQPRRVLVLVKSLAPDRSIRA